MAYTAIIKQDGTITQDATTNFTDGRIWKLATGESLRILENRVLKMGSNGAKLFESEDLLTDKFTLAVNREEDKVSVIRKGLEPIIFKTSTLSTNSIGVVAMPDITPLRAIIDKSGEKIIWLGNDNKLYKMDLDGGNLESVSVGDNVSTFCMDSTNIVYLIQNDVSSNSVIYSKKVNPDFSIETLPGMYLTHRMQCLDGFILDNTVYFLGTDLAGFNKALLLKFAKEDWNNTENWVFKDLTTDYEIVYNSVCQFNASGFDNNGTFFGEKDGVMRRWQVDLDNLECTPARWETYPTKQVFSNDTNLSLVDYSGVNGNNCDNCGRITSKYGVTGSI